MKLNLITFPFNTENIWWRKEKNFQNVFATVYAYDRILELLTSGDQRAASWTHDVNWTYITRLIYFLCSEGKKLRQRFLDAADSDKFCLMLQWWSVRILDQTISLKGITTDIKNVFWKGLLMWKSMSVFSSRAYSDRVI